MAKLSLLLVLVSALVAGVVVGAAPVYAADCTHASDTISVNIDVKPGSFPNPINLRSAGVLPVAVLGSSAALSSYRHLMIKDALSEVRVKNLMITDFETVSEEMSVQRWSMITCCVIGTGASW